MNIDNIAPSKRISLVPMPGEDIVCCANCKSPNLHLCGARVWQGESLVSIHPRNDVSFTHIPQGELQTRGSHVVADAWCEGCDHVTEVALRFHKGSLFLSAYAREPDETAPTTSKWDKISEFWRD